MGCALFFSFLVMENRSSISWLRCPHYEYGKFSAEKWESRWRLRGLYQNSKSDADAIILSEASE
jgi:hypothetical protein